MIQGVLGRDHFDLIRMVVVSIAWKLAFEQGRLVVRKLAIQVSVGEDSRKRITQHKLLVLSLRYVFFKWESALCN